MAKTKVPDPVSGETSGVAQAQQKARGRSEEKGRQDLEAFRARLPYPTISTNIPGVYVSGPLPDHLDANTASRTTRIKHGLMLRRPDETDDAALRKAWKHAFSKPWATEKQIVPEMETHVGVTHRHRGAKAREEADFLSKNWAGSVLPGNWNTVSASWVVPAVVKPNAPLGPGDFWNSVSWIGIGGDTLIDPGSDLLQAGIDQAVNKHGKASYFAWFEWVSTSIRLTLGDQTPSNPALCSDEGVSLLLAFRGENNYLNFLISTDQGNSFGHKKTTGETSSYGPAMAFSLDGMLVAWTGHGNNYLNVAPVTVNGTNISLGPKVILKSLKSKKGPALAMAASLVALAWIDEQSRVNVAISEDVGQTFGDPYVSPYSSTEAPTLTFLNDRFVIGWKGANEVVNVGAVMLNNGTPTGIVNVTLVPAAATPSSPALLAQEGTLFLSWRENGDHLSVTMSADGGQTFGGIFASPIERSPSGPALVSLDGTLFIGWRGEQDYLDVASVGVRNRAIVGFGPVPSYQFETEIKNFPVTEGDEVQCTLSYLEDMSGGQILLGNLTTGYSLPPITLVAPVMAEFTGSTIEWILECPTLTKTQQLETLPQFEEVTFNNAVGCGTGVAGNASNGQMWTIVDASNSPETSEVLGPAPQATVSIKYLSST